MLLLMEKRTANSPLGTVIVALEADMTALGESPMMWVRGDSVNIAL